MPRPTPEEVEKEIEVLREQVKTVRHHSAFGDDNRAQIEAQIRVAEEDLDDDDIDDFINDAEQEAARDMRYWLAMRMEFHPKVGHRSANEIWEDRKFSIQNIRDKFPNAEFIQMTELVPAAEVGKGPWKLYIYDSTGYHDGARWFRTGKPKYPAEEISFSRAKQFTNVAIGKGLEVRICDGMDNLVFRSERGKVTYGSTFWNEANPDPAAVAVADRLQGGGNKVSNQTNFVSNYKR